ncbi:hypothetical protein J6590_011136 [Homalodisca vitripennis]|nr:hypothetical protein J6590_011136 [Homalodisca vitripennis]
MVNNHHPITTADTLHVIVGATVPGNNAKREPCTARGWAELFNNGKLFGLEDHRGELNDLMSVWLEKLRKSKEKIGGTKLADGKSIRGAGRLTDKVIDELQSYYRNAIRGNYK